MAQREPAVRRRSSPKWGIKTFALTLGFVAAMISLGMYQVWQRYELYSLGMKLSGETLLLVLSNGAQFNLTLHQFSGEQNRFTDELRNLLRRRGIRILPDDWDFGYKGNFLL